MKHLLHYIISSTYLYFVSFFGEHVQNVEDLSPVTLNILDDAIVASVSPRFVSVALDSGLPALNWEGLNFSSPRLRALARALSPAFIRLGGSSADYMLFDDDHAAVNWTLLCTCFGKTPPPCGSTRPKVALTRIDWDSFNEFANSTSMEILFDFNLLLRDRDTCELNLTNVRRLLDYSHSMGYNKQLVFEVGNEPNQYPGEFGFEISADQNGRDAKRLYSFLDSAPYRQWYLASGIVGPDVTGTGDEEYIRRYINVSGNYINAVTWHHYSLHAEVATIEQFLDPDIYDDFLKKSQEIRRAVYPYLPVWLGETNTAWGGGKIGLTDAYINGLMWLDKLGAAALTDTQVVIRQTFYGYNYSLVDHKNQPLPDYWLTLLHKKLVGQKVLSVKTDLSADVSKFIRVYAHCTTQSSNYNRGSITFFVINLSKSDHVILLGGKYAGASVDAYVMTSGEGSLLSRNVDLNGRRLEMRSETELPDLTPKRLSPITPSTLPASAYGFYVITDANSRVCL